MVRSSVHRRAGFTLVEALVVVSIIVILASLTTAAVVRALQSAEDARVVAEIKQLENAIAAFKSEFGVDYVPGHVKLFNNLNNYNAANLKTTDPVAFETKQFLATMFPRLPFAGTIAWSGSGSGTYELFGPECLVFFLGGRNGLDGFSKNQTDPWNGAGSRNKPFFEFDQKRLKLMAWNTSFPAYLDPYNSGAAEDQPYYYFTSKKGGDYSALDTFVPSPGAYGTIRIAPFRDTSNRFINPNGFQILSAGRDKRIGNFTLTTAEPFVKWSNGTFTSAASPGNEPQDNLANFHPVKLGIPQ
ncbi:MAG: type II secretion system GspH family protein [Gemmataceae bacterium]|nr:type II secretion system GspH family protein [Gemmataceae bacterium]